MLAPYHVEGYIEIRSHTEEEIVSVIRQALTGATSSE
jgi:hypothetical protein